MTVPRYSTKTLSQLGASSRPLNIDGTIITSYSGATGNEPILPVDGLLSYDVPSGISPRIYSVLFSHFSGRSSSVAYAETMVLVALDVARQLNVDPITFVKTFDLNDENSIVAQNFIRTVSLKVSKLTQNTNNQLSKINRQIIT